VGFGATINLAARVLRSVTPERRREHDEGSMNAYKIFEHDLDVTGVTDDRITLEAILSGQTRIPPQGARIDLDIRAIVETAEGHTIALTADGAGVPRAGEPVGDSCENVSFTTAAETYAWVNKQQVWGSGTVNFATGKIHIDASRH
jgi:hypothetical protein